jgi:hypothetical protein
MEVGPQSVPAAPNLFRLLVEIVLPTEKSHCRAEGIELPQRQVRRAGSQLFDLGPVCSLPTFSKRLGLSRCQPHHARILLASGREVL